LTRQIIEREKLTAMMVTHSMQQAVELPDRIIMMHRGQIVEDFQDEQKKRVRIQDLLDTFDRVQKRDLLDESVTELLLHQYV
jgi:putative ABC transport system ATP-binding protein